MKDTHVIKENAKEYVGKARGFLKEFREFAVRGNVIDLAVGIIIGGAFNKIVSSLVADIVMPVLGLFIGGVKFTDLKWIIREASPGREALTFNYGQFIQTTFDFILMAFSVFLIIKVINSVRRYHEKQEKENPQPAQAPAPTKEEMLLTEIRDALKAQSGAMK